MTAPIAHAWNGVTATVYYLDKGDKVSRHRHNVEHTTSVISGMTRVEIGVGTGHEFIMTPELDAYVLPANVDHEITAVANGTIVMNMIAGTYTTTTHADAPPAQSGGVELHDGTVVAHEAD